MKGEKVGRFVNCHFTLSSYHPVALSKCDFSNSRRCHPCISVNLNCGVYDIGGDGAKLLQQQLPEGSRSRARVRGCKSNFKSWANSIRTACAVETGHACSHCLVSIRFTKCIDTQESATPLSNVESQLEMLQGFKTRCDRPSYDPSNCHCSSNSGNVCNSNTSAGSSSSNDVEGCGVVNVQRQSATVHCPFAFYMMSPVGKLAAISGQRPFGARHACILYIRLDRGTSYRVIATNSSPASQLPIRFAKHKRLSALPLADLFYLFSSLQTIL